MLTLTYKQSRDTTKLEMFLYLSSSGLKLVATSGLTWKIYMLQLYGEWLLGETGCK